MSIPRSTFVSVPLQTERLEERRSSGRLTRQFRGADLVVLPGVYGTSIDTELMIDTVDISPEETFLEIGSGTGAVSLAVAKRAKSGLGVDINRAAVENGMENARLAQISNVRFLRSDGFEAVEGTFDVVICNPPYGNQPVQDEIDRMFWDPGDDLKIRFFCNAGSYLNPGGRAYFGWANFADIDVDLPLRLAEENGWRITRTVQRNSRDGSFDFIVFELKKR